MTKEITKAIILQEMQDKLKLRDFDPAKFLFDETVVPVYNIEQHLETWTVAYADVSVTSAAAFTLFEVPANERWSLRGYNPVFMASGAYKITGIYLWRSTNNTIYLDMVKGQTVSYAVNLPVTAVLEPGNRLDVFVDDYTSTATFRLYIDYMKETIR